MRRLKPANEPNTFEPSKLASRANKFTKKILAFSENKKKEYELWDESPISKFEFFHVLEEDKSILAK